MRAQQHSDIQSLMKSNLDQEADLSEILQSLQDMDPKEMEKLQPPSVSRILMDPNLANQSRADLSLMVENIAEAMSCKAAMRMAFRTAGRKQEKNQPAGSRKHQLQEAVAAQQFQIRSCSTQERVLLKTHFPCLGVYSDRGHPSPIQAERTIPVRAGFWDSSTKSPGDMHKQIANDCKLHLFPPTPRPSNSSKVVTDKPCKSTRSQNTVRRCHRLPR
ncbi:hypothetical protein DPEC_G00361490 [Dallia pectoralis]|nr:hypothetical protein DPEC_G00361490 [Dallia pectoralis]